MQTAQQICNSLQLPGMHTCNGIVDVLNSHCGIHEQPVVPTSDVDKYGINVLVYHHETLPQFPEKTRDGLKRLVLSTNMVIQLWILLSLHNRFKVRREGCPFRHTPLS